MRDNDLEKSVFSLAKSYGRVVSPCEKCGRMPKIDFLYSNGINDRVEVFCKGGRFLGRHTKVTAGVVNNEDVSGKYMEALDVWNELQMKPGNMRIKVHPGRKKNND